MAVGRLNQAVLERVTVRQHPYGKPPCKLGGNCADGPASSSDALPVQAFRVRNKPQGQLKRLQASLSGLSAPPAALLDYSVPQG